MWSIRFLVSYSIFIAIVTILFGKFNDGGWYTLAALSIKSGAQPFIDFHYPHTPHFAYFLSKILHLCPESIHPVLYLRFFCVIIWLISVLLTIALVKKENYRLLMILILCQPYQIFCIIKCHGVINFYCYLFYFYKILTGSHFQDF